MNDRKIIEILVTPQGRTSVQTLGFRGAACREAVRGNVFIHRRPQGGRLSVQPASIGASRLATRSKGALPGRDADVPER
jgi:hypothetical protein